MKKFTLKNLIILLSFNTVLAQTATDFITDDCNGVSHSLFDSLNAGNVIVLAWVMPCGPCATYTLPAYSAVQSFATSHPDRVDFYLVDDYANTACPTLVNWGISNSMSTNTAFSSSSISMSDYGSSGMPKVVVLGNANHSVFYNENDDKITFNGVQNAINNALLPVGVDDEIKSHINISVFPNPVKNILNVSCTSFESDNLTFDIVNILGKSIYSSTKKLSSSSNSFTKKIDVSQFDTGIYFLNVNSDFSYQSKKIILKD